MPPEKPVEPLPLEYARPRPAAPPARGLFETVGMHFGGGLGFSSLVGVVLLGWGQYGRYPIAATYDCGGIFITLIQLGLLTLAASIREWVTTCRLAERGAGRSVAAGVLGAVLVYGVPWLMISLIPRGHSPLWLAMVIPGSIYPVLAAWWVYRPAESRGGPPAPPL